MRVTIIPTDGYVSVDGLGYADLDLSSVDPSIHAVQFNGAAGWIEFVDAPDGTKPANQPIDSIAAFQSAIDAWNVANEEANKPAPEPEPPTAEQNKETASRLLAETDYTQLPDVNITNKDEFAAYRAVIRDYVLNPVEGEIEWPTEPDPAWAEVLPE